MCASYRKDAQASIVSFGLREKESAVQERAQTLVSPLPAGRISPRRPRVRAVCGVAEAV